MHGFLSRFVAAPSPCFAALRQAALFLGGLAAFGGGALHGQTAGTALVRHAPTLNGRIQGSVQQMNGESVNVNSPGSVSGDLLVPGTPTVTLNGSVTFGGTIAGSGSASPTGYQVILNSGATLGHLRTKTNPVTLPTVSAPPAPSGTRSVVINTSSDSPGSFSTLKNLTLNSNVGQVVVPAGTYGAFTANSGCGFTLGVAGATQATVYNLQSLTLNAQSRLTVVGPVVLNLASGLNANASSQLGSAANLAWLQINLASGGLTLNSSSFVYGFVVAPSGAVILNAGSELDGGLTSDSLTINANGLLKVYTQSSPNQAPVANAQTVHPLENTALAITLTGSDPEGAALSYAVVTPPAHGTLTGTAPSLTYTPATNYTQQDTFTFKVNDGQVDSSPATVSIVVTPVNQAPVAYAASVQTKEDTALAIGLVATDVDSTTLTYATVAGPSHGTLSGSGASRTYTPALHYSGPDSFTFQASDGQALSNIATVSITVTAVNYPPTAVAQTLTMQEGANLAIALSATDIENNALTYRVTQQPAHGQLISSGLTNGSGYTYQPGTYYYGDDSFTFVANDGTSDSTPATVLIHVQRINHAPVAAAQTVQASEETARAVTLTASDVDGDALTYAVATPPQHGMLTGTAPNLTYTPAALFHGTDTFTFTVTDVPAVPPALTSTAATVTINVAHVNHAPTASSQTVATNENTAVAITLAGSDVDGDALTYQVVTQPAHGTLSGTAPHLTYTPALNYRNTAATPDTFTFRVSDAQATSASATVTLIVAPVNQPPSAQAQSLTLAENSSAPITLGATDPENDPLTYRVTVPPVHGVLTGTPPRVTYVAATNYFGADQFQFVAKDAALDSAPATVSLTVTHVNVIPTVSLTAPAAGSVTNLGAAIGLAATASDVDGTVVGVDFYVDGALLAHSAAAPYTASWSSPTVGAHLLSAQAVDNEGGRGQSATVSIRVNAPPLVTLTAPANGALFQQGAVVALQASASDSDGQVVKVEYYDSAVKIGESTGAPYPFAAALAAGAHVLTAVAYDNDGAKTTSAPAGVTVNAAPSVSLTAPPSGAVFTPGQSIQLTAAASDSDGTVTLVEFLADGVKIGQSTAGPFAFAWTNATNGAHVLTARATDNRGGMAYATNVPVTVDVPPVVSLTAPLSGALFAVGAPVSLQAAASDPDGSVARVEFYEGAVLLGSVTQAPYSYTWNGVAGGMHTVFAVAVDDQGVRTLSAPVSFTVNAAPVVSAGAAPSAVQQKTAPLSGSATDDGLPAGSTLSLTWSLVSGPGAAVLADPAAAATSVIFAQPGAYVLRLSATDGQLTSSSDLHVTVARGNEPPVVSAGPNQRITYPALASLAGSVTDDGLPAGATVTSQWSKTSGPGAVTFTDATSASTQAAFSVAGSYRLTLSASDSELSARSSVTVTVTPQNQPPTVSAGPAQTITLGASADLQGTANDDGLPASGSLSVFWSKVSGPGPVIFGNSAQAATTATFSDPGAYVLRLTANDSQLQSSADVSVTVQAKPDSGLVVSAGPNQSISGVTGTTLHGSIVESGLPAPPTATSVWTQVSGPGPVVFAHADRPSTAVALGLPGTYLLQLTAHDGGLTAQGQVTIVLGSGAPTLSVDAGGSQTALTGQDLLLLGRVTEDGAGPNPPPLTILWTLLSGPGTATFADATVAAAHVTFSTSGAYALQLQASDGVRTSSSTATVTVGVVNQPPVVSAGPDQTGALPFGGYTTTPGPVHPVHLVKVSDSIPYPIALDYSEARKKLLMSLNYPNGRPYTFATVSEDASVVPYTTVQGLTDEVYFASARDDGGGVSLGGFLPGETFSGTGVPGQILRMSPDGSSIQNPWVTLPGEPGLLRGALHIDRTGVFGGDLIVSTDSGGVWRVNSAGLAHQLANVHTLLEGVTTVPNDPRYGPWAGKIITGGETDGAIYAVGADGQVGRYPVPINGPEAIQIVPAAENLFLVNYSDNGVIWGAPYSEFSGLTGDILVEGEFDNLVYDMRWNGTSFDATPIAPAIQGGNLEGMTFAPAGLLSIPAAAAKPIHLHGTVTDDDGLPVGGVLTAHWDQVAGPGHVSFAAPDSPSTDVSFDAIGVYELRLTASDGELSAFSTVRVTVLEPHQPPVVSAGPDRTLASTAEAALLDGYVAADATAAAPAVAWSALSGPGSVTFAEAAAPSTTASFSATGLYVLQLSADDGISAVTSTMTVRVATPCGVATPASAVAWWPADGSARDLLGGNDTHLYGGADYGPGEVGMAFRLDGVAGYAKAPASATLDLGQAGGSFSVELWVNPQPSSYTPLVEWNNGSQFGVHLWHFPGEAFYANLVDVNGGYHSIQTAGGFFTPGQWTHVVLTYDSVSGIARVFRNGTQFGGTYGLGSFTAQTSYDLYFGRRPGSAFFAGELDEITLYRQVLDPSVPVLLYAAGASGKCAPEPNLPPIVSTGRYLSVSAPGLPVVLTGNVTDDGRPEGAPLAIAWTVLDGPGQVAFSDATSPAATATFDTPGIYLLQLAANDTESSASARLEVRVGDPCTLPAPSGLVAWWPANGSGQEVVSGANASLAGTATFAPGKVSEAFSLDGASGSVVVSKAPSLDVGAGSAFTIELWARPEVPDRPLVEWIDATTNSYGVHLWESSGGTLYVNLIDINRGNHYFTTPGGMFTLGQWTHVALTYDQVTGIARVYANGVQFGPDYHLGGFRPQTTYDLYFGYDPGQQLCLRGEVDEISIYNRALFSEISQVYAAGATGKCPLNLNQPPVVKAGPAPVVPQLHVPVALHGSVSDDGLPEGAALTSQWSVVDGPGAVTFGDPAQPVTTASFSAPGVYLLQLAANDTDAMASALLEVRAAADCAFEPPSSLVAWWPGNGHARDLIGGADAQLGGGVAYAPGEVSEAFSFNGAASRAFVPRAASTDLGAAGGSLTVELWVKPGVSQNAPLLEWNDAASGSYGAHFWQSGDALYVNLIDLNRGNHYFTTAAGFFTAGQWTHLAVAYENATGITRVFRNGVQFGADYQLGAFTPQTSYDLYFGFDPPSVTCFTGALDEISLYQAALLPEIGQIYQAGAIGKCPPDLNRPPYVDAGPNQDVASLAPVTLSGYVTPGGRPSGLTLSSLWTQVGGSGTVTFADPASPVTTAAFSAPGVYVLKLTASDGGVEASATTTVSVSNACLAPPTGLVGWWPGNGTPVDVVGGRDALALNRLGYTTGEVGQAFSFDGVAAYAKVPRNSTDDVGALGSGLTIEFWARTPTALNAPFVEWGNDGAYGAHVWQLGTTLYVNLISTNGGNHYFSTAGGFFLPEEWVHAAVTYDPVSGLCRVFRNGAQFGGDVYLGPFTPQTTYDLYFGCRPVSGEKLTGAMDEIGLYARPLAPAEVASIYAAGAAGKCVPPKLPQAPFVYAGGSQTVTLPAVLTLHGVDHDPDGNSIGVLWSVLSGPGTVTFGDEQSLTSTAQFSLPGAYVLQLLTSDNSLSSTDTLRVSVLPSTQPNQPPAVSAGPAQTIVITDGAALPGVVTDDGLPYGQPLVIHWSESAGPGTVTFDTPGAPATGAHFSVPGDYTLRLTASDSQFTTRAETFIHVTTALPPNQPPVVYAGENRTALLPGGIDLAGHATDDGLPPHSALQYQWTRLGGPGTVTFSAPTQAATHAAFSVPGTYLLQLAVSDSQLSASSTVTVEVIPLPSLPTVSAGANQSIALHAAALLSGSAADGAGGTGLTLRWSKVSGPGLVGFVSPASAQTTATFSAQGLYDLRLTATDSLGIASSDVLVAVGQALTAGPPVVSAGPDQTIPFGQAAVLQPTIDDDGLSGGTLSVSWQILSGPGSVQLTRQTGDTITASFDRIGRYVLQLTVGNGAFTASAQVTITVTPGDQPPPVVTVTTPVAGASLPAGLPVSLQAAAVPGGANPIASVEFFVNGASIGVSTSAPYGAAWTPQATGPATLTAVATDRIGVTGASAPVVVTVAPPVPFVRIASPLADAGLTLGTPVSVVASASYRNGVDHVEFFANGLSIGTAATAPYTVSWTGAVSGAYSLTATLTGSDRATATSDPVLVHVVSAADAGAPLVVQFATPQDGETITAPTALTGTVQSPILSDWQVDYRRVGDKCGDWKTCASGTGQVDGAALGTFDPTLLRNGVYQLELLGYDYLGQQASDLITVVVDGNMKVGNFTATFNDLQLPLAGIPITVARTYDSRDTCPGDFGVGWNLDVSSVQLTESQPLGLGWSYNVTVSFTSFSTFAVEEDSSHLITITFPGGETYKFVARAAAQRSYPGEGRFGNDTTRIVPWSTSDPFGFVITPMPGTQGKLEALGVPSSVYMLDDSGGSINWVNAAGDPFADVFSDPTGWRFTALDGRILEFDGAGKLTKVTEPGGQSLTFTANGIFHSSGKSIAFHRDAQKRIDAITDPNGAQLHYVYDANNDLRQFFDRTHDPLAGASPTVGYTYLGSSHLIDTMVDGRGIPASRNYYDDAGRLYKTVDAAGNATLFTHDVNGRTETITDRAGRVTVHRYDERGNITRTQAADGSITDTAYHRWSDGTLSDLKETESIAGLFSDGAGGLAQATHTTRYTYGDPNGQVKDDGLLRQVVDPLGHTTSISYDGQGNLLAMTDPRASATGAGPTMVNTYVNGTNRVQTSTDAAGHVTSYAYDAFGNLSLSILPVTVVDASGQSTVQTLVTESDYDASGNLLQTKDATGHLTTYQYDLNGNCLFERTTRTLSGGQVVPVVTEHEYDASGRLVRTWDAEHPRATHPVPTSETIYDDLGHVWKTYDALRHVTEQLYDFRGQLTQTNFADGTSESITYDADGRRQYLTDRRGKNTLSVYDPVGRLAETDFCDGGTTPVQVLSVSTFDAAGRVLTAQDADGHALTNIYDAAGRRTGVLDAQHHLSQYAYDENGNQLSFTDAKGQTTSFGYDALNRRVQTLYPAAQVWTGAAYATVPTDAWTTYDELGRRVAEYEQAPVNQALAARRTKRYVYAPLGLLTDVVDAAGQVTNFGYDELGNELTQTDALLHTTTYIFDSLGRRTARQLPAGQTESMAYDDAGNLQQRTDFNGRTTQYQYDALNRLRFRIPDAAFGEPSVEWRYTASGQRERMIDGHGVTLYTYDSRDRLQGKASPEGTLAYTRDPVGNLLSIASGTPDGASITYGYDSLNRLQSVADANQQRTTYGYDAVGNLQTVTLPNGVNAAYGYDALNRLGSLGYNARRTPAAAAGIGYTYGLLPTGQRHAVQEESGRAAVYAYDNLWRLSQETIAGDPAGKNGTLGYAYDAVGNRLARTSTVAGLAGQSFTYDADDRLNGDTCDPNGNTRAGAASQPAASYTQPTAVTPAPILGADTYDSLDRLNARTGSNGTVHVAYDGDGRKVAESVTQNGVTTTTTYLVDDQNPTGYAQVLEEKTNGALTRVYTWGHELISEDQLDGSGAWRLAYYGYDGHGNVRFLTGSSNLVTDTYDFDAFGNLTNLGAGNLATPNLHLYCGEQFDGSLGMYYLRARLMNPLTGRFWTADSYEGNTDDPRSLHKYLYAKASPVNYWDPSGHESLAEVEVAASIDANVEKDQAQQDVKWYRRGLINKKWDVFLVLKLGGDGYSTGAGFHAFMYLEAIGTTAGVRYDMGYTRDGGDAMGGKGSIGRFFGVFDGQLAVRPTDRLILNRELGARGKMWRVAQFTAGQFLFWNTVVIPIAASVPDPLEKTIYDLPYSQSWAPLTFNCAKWAAEGSAVAFFPIQLLPLP